MKAERSTTDQCSSQPPACPVGAASARAGRRVPPAICFKPQNSRIRGARTPAERESVAQHRTSQRVEAMKTAIGGGGALAQGVPKPAISTHTHPGCNAAGFKYQA
jgi:hypothetical protein